MQTAKEKEIMKSLEKMAVEDKKTIEKYLNKEPGKRSFRVGKTKSNVRNYRDFEIYTSLQTEEIEAYRTYQNVADFVMLHTNRNGKTNVFEGDDNSELPVDQVILNLCKYQIFNHEVTKDNLRTLADHLLAGDRNRETTINKDICSQMRKEGKQVLGDIYLRQLSELQKKYGGSRLLKLSPSGYLKAYDELSADFSCIHDMSIFFSREEKMGNISDQAKLDQAKGLLLYFEGFWSALKKRHQDFVNGDFDGKADQEYKATANKLMEEAKASGIFAKAFKAVDITPDSRFKTKEKQSKKASDAIKEYKEELLKPITRKFHDVTIDNFIDMSEMLVKNIEELCRKVSESDDDRFMERYSMLFSLSRAIRAVEVHIKGSDVYSQAGTKYRQVNGIHDTRKKLDAISKEYPVYFNMDNILKARINSIKKYGYTNRDTLVHVEDMEEVLTTVRERYRKAEKTLDMPMSVKEALELKIVANAFRDLQKIDFMQVEKELKALRRVKQYREADPDSYRLKLSFKDHEKAEAMCELLPLYEAAYELTLRYVGIKKHKEELGSQLEAQWREAVDKYYAKAYRIETDYGMRKFTVDRLEKAREQKEKLIANTSLWEENMSEREKRMVAEAVDFISDPMHIQGKEQLQDAVNVTSYLTKIYGEERNIEPDEEQFISLSLFLHDAALSFEQTENKLLEGSYRDYVLFEARDRIASCERKFYYLNQFFGVEEVKNKFLEKYEENPTMEVMEHILNSFKDTYERVKAIASYSEGLEMEYAYRNGVTSMSYFHEGGVGTVNGADIHKMANSKLREGKDVVEELRLKKDGLEEYNRQQMKARVRKAVGREVLASEAKVFMANLKTATDFTSLAGNLVGTPLQIFSWIKHEPRTAEHGEVVYDKWHEKYKELMNTLGKDHAMGEGRLELWKRGNSQHIPEVNLDRLFSSELKKNLIGTLNQKVSQESDLLSRNKEDKYDEYFQKAIEAIRCYSTIVGIVNSDTTEMEMAFLDRFLKSSVKYDRENYPYTGTLVQSRLRLLGEIRDAINGSLKPTLEDTMTKEELDLINEKTTAYVEDTIFGANMEDSNIQDIPLFLHEPNINDVRQSSIGDCWLVSAISALVRTNPNYIKSMFHDTGDGNVIVRLYEAERNGRVETDVTQLLSGKDLKVYPCYFKLRKHYETGWGNASDCTWVQLLEKAYALGGFSRRKEMKVKDNKLYNVTDELTYGHQGVALLHLTGVQPEELKKNTVFTCQEKAFLDAGFLASALDRLGEGLQTTLCDYLFAEGKVSGENTIDYLINEAKKCCYGDDEKKSTEDTIRENIGKMRMGIRIDTDTIAATKKLVYARRSSHKERLGLNENLTSEKVEIAALASWAEYFESPRNDNYTPEMNLFYKRCKAAFAQGSTLSVAIPHCVDLLDAEEKNGRMFILLRDPFNIYNNEYVIEKGKEVKKEERFTTVISGHRENRRIMGDKDQIIRNAFRGTSWFDVRDLYEIVYGMYRVSPNLQIPNYKV